MKYDIISIGSGLVDSFIYTNVREHNNLISFKVGTKVLINKIDFAIGGGRFNTSITASKLGLKSAIITKIGSGFNSNIILDELKKHDIDFLGVMSKEHAGYSIILETNKKHRTILTYKGASNNLKFSELNLKKLNAKWFHFTSAGNTTFKTQNKLVDFAKNNNIKISFNPSTYQVMLGKKHLSKILRNCNVLSLNKEEAEILVGKNDTFRKIHKLGPKIVCITDGEKEGQVYDGINLYKFHPNKIKINESTGAGDTFASSLIAGLIKFNDLEKAIKLAMTNSESLIKHKGSKSGLLSMNQALKLVNTNKFKIEKI